MSGGHADFANLVAYRLGELDDVTEAALEEHYLGCADCAARLAEIEALGDGVRRAFAGGGVGMFVTPAIIDAFRARGVRVREYRVPHNGGVNCCALPDDEVLAGYLLDVPLHGVDRVDAIVVFEGEHRFEDVPFDRASGMVVVTPPMRHLRAMPAHRQMCRLVSVEPNGDRVLGEYTFNHSPA